MATAPKTRKLKPADKPAGRVLSFEIDGAAYSVSLTRLTALDQHELRRQTGWTLLTLGDAMGGDFSIDLVAVLLWLARRQAGETVTFAEVAEEIDMTSTIVPKDEPESDDPNS